MNIAYDIWNYTIENWDYLLVLLWNHLLMVLVAIVFALIIGVPLGVLSALKPKFAPLILSIANFIQITPSLALLAVMLVVFGLGFNAATAALFLYSLLPIIRNTYVGVKEVDPILLEAGQGLGLTIFQILKKVQLPLSLPFLFAGVRVASVIAVGVASLAPFVGGSGLGEVILSGINNQVTVQIYAGAIPAALLAVVADILLGITEKHYKKIS